MKLYYSVNNWNGNDFINIYLELDNKKVLPIKCLYKNDKTLLNMVALGQIEKLPINLTAEKKEKKGV